MKTVASEVAEILVKINAVSFNVEKPYTFASGIISPIYTDLRLLMSYPDHRRRVVELLLDVASKKVGLENIDVISGTASAGIPWASWLSERMNRPMIYVRKEGKHHGKERTVEGVVKDGNRVLVVEDLVSTGGSSINTVHNIRGSGGVVSDCVAIFTYGFEESQKNFADMNVLLHTLCDFPAAIEAAVKMKHLTKEQAGKARAWNRNPREWKP